MVFAICMRFRYVPVNWYVLLQIPINLTEYSYFISDLSPSDSSLLREPPDASSLGVATFFLFTLRMRLDPTTVLDKAGVQYRSPGLNFTSSLFPSE